MPSVAAEVRSSTLEYRSSFADPLIERWDASGKIAQAAFEAFKDWGVTLEQVTKTEFANNAAQLGWAFQLRGRYNFRITMAGIALSIWNPYWDEAAEVQNLIQKGSDAVKAAVGLDFAKHDIVLDIHVAALSKTPREIMAPFSPQNAAVPNDAITGAGFSLHTEGRSLTADLSAHFKDAVYIRIVHTFAPTTDLTVMLTQLKSDEVELLNMLSLTLAGVND